VCKGLLTGQGRPVSKLPVSRDLQLKYCFPTTTGAFLIGIAKLLVAVFNNLETYCVCNGTSNDLAGIKRHFFTLSRTIWAAAKGALLGFPSEFKLAKSSLALWYKLPANRSVFFSTL